MFAGRSKFSRGHFTVSSLACAASLRHKARHNLFWYSVAGPGNTCTLTWISVAGLGFFIHVHRLPRWSLIGTFCLGIVSASSNRTNYEFAVSFYFHLVSSFEF